MSFRHLFELKNESAPNFQLTIEGLHLGSCRASLSGSVPVMVSAPTSIVLTCWFIIICGGDSDALLVPGCSESDSLDNDLGRLFLCFNRPVDLGVDAV